MTYTYENYVYNKRPLTKDIALCIVSSEFSLAKEKSAELVRLVKPYKLGELAAQQDACPILNAEELRERVDYVRNNIEGFRIRRAQLSGIIAAGEAVENVDDRTALFLIANGSIAVIAPEYKNGSDITLLSKGILPLVSLEKLQTGSLILIRDITRDINGGKTNAALVFSDRLEPIDITLAAYDKTALEQVLN